MTRTGVVSVWVTPGADQGGMDDVLVEVLSVFRHPRRISWTTVQRIFDEGHKWSFWDRNYGTRLTSLHFFFVDFYKIRGRASLLSTTRDTNVRHVVVIPPHSSSAGRVYDGVNRDINQLARKEHPDN
jgi:hypothetical protein